MGSSFLSMIYLIKIQSLSLLLHLVRTGNPPIFPLGFLMLLSSICFSSLSCIYLWFSMFTNCNLSSLFCCCLIFFAFPFLWLLLSVSGLSICLLIPSSCLLSTVHSFFPFTSDPGCFPLENDFLVIVTVDFCLDFIGDFRLRELGLVALQWSGRHSWSFSRIGWELIIIMPLDF